MVISIIVKFCAFCHIIMYTELHLANLLIRFEEQVSSRPRRTLFSSQSCSRMNWRWSTWSAPSWWLCANCLSCSPLAPTTCYVSNWWCSWEPSGRTMRWEKRATESQRSWMKLKKKFESHCFSDISVRWSQQKACQRWACLSFRQHVVVGGWGHWVWPLTSSVSRCSR